jgi:hypothetical protein
MHRIYSALILTIVFYLQSIAVEAQSVPRDDLPRFTVEGYSEDGHQGTVVLIFGVSMSDCVGNVEVENLENNKKYSFRPTLDNYYVRDGEMEEIFAKLPIGKFRKLVDKKEGFTAMITIYARGGRKIFQGKSHLKVSESETVEDKRTASK